MTVPAAPRTGRRAVLLGGLGALGAAAAGSAYVVSQDEPDQAVSEPIPFHGARQPGVEQEPTRFACWTAFDLAPTADRDSARRLMRVWTDDIRRLMSGGLPVTDVSDELASPASHLTATVGFGPRFFDAVDLAEARPAWLDPLPSFEIDELEDRWSGGDVVVQLRCDDPLLLTHARTQLVANAGDLVRHRWTQAGFRKPAPDGPGRNLFGQIDGIVQPDLTGDADLIWHDSSASDWLRGGTSMVVRRIRMDLPTWSAVDRTSRERSVGRRLDDGRPLVTKGSGDEPDLTATDELGLEAIDLDSHMRRAMPRAPHEQILRRPYSYDDPVAGDAGMVFVSFQRDVTRQFLPIQRRLAESDLMNLWTTPVGSAVFAVPGGCAEGEYLGQRLLA